MIKFGLESSQASFDIAKTFSVSELGKSHTEELVVAREFSSPVISLVPVNAFVEFVSGQGVQNLREDDSS